MKEIWNFLIWQFRKFEVWQLAFIFAMFLQGVAVPLDNPYALWVSGSGMAIILGFFFKWAVWDGTRSAWSRYKEERNQLLTTIKNSDSK